jgi:hypothetical protein
VQVRCSGSFLFSNKRAIYKRIIVILFLKYQIRLDGIIEKFAQGF